MPPTLYLIDGHALAYRAYFALSTAGGGRWKTRNGEPTAGVYGFASVLLRLLEQEKPEYLAVAFDTGKTFRDDIYPAYKATRAKMPDDLRPQIERIRQMVDAFHFPRLEMEGYEADDVLGSIAVKAVKQDLWVKIITGDRDLLQLVDERITVNLATGKLSEARDFTPLEVKNQFGIRPDQVVDYKALVGDTSDNIPGVAGIGEKTAISLLTTYPTLEAIYANLDSLQAKVKEKLEKGRESALLSQKLARIRIDLGITLRVEEARTDHINTDSVEELFNQLEFKSLTVRLRNLGVPASDRTRGGQMSLFASEPISAHTAETYPLEVKIIQDSKSLELIVKELRAARSISLDTEATSTDPLRAKLVGISLAVKEGTGIYIPTGHATGEPQIPLEMVREALKPVLADPHIEKTGHNLKYDSLLLDLHGMPVAPLAFDSMIAQWLIEPATRRLGLKDMAEDLLGVTMTHIEELIGSGKNQGSMAEVQVGKAASYAAADAEVALRLKPLLQKRLEELQAKALFDEMEMPLVPVLAEMEKTGILLDTGFLGSMAAELNKRMLEVEALIHEQAGFQFNINSTQQLSKVLFENLHLEPPDRKKKTTSGNYSTSAEVLEELRGKHPVVDMVLEYRELSKIKSTYVDALPLQINPVTGRVHTSYNQTGSVTGRLASSEPNLQNIPTRTEMGRRVRYGFVAAPGNLLLSVDYSQIELRIVAHMAEDEAMLAAFRQGQDIHAATAAAIYRIPLESVTKEQRRHAKAINFGLIYGMSAFGLSRSTDLTLAEAEDFVQAYFQQFPGVKSYLDGIRRLAARQGYVETLLGRRRYFPNLKSQANPAMRAREEREAINAPVQGTAADIIKLAMIHLLPAIRQAGLGARLLLQVHDELVLECPENEIAPTAKLVCRVMENAHPLSIPLLTEARCGISWGDMQPLTVDREKK